MGEPRFLEFVREERLFCAAVAHLLLQRGDNLRLFLELIDAGLSDDGQLGATDLEQAEIYLEFTYLRDRWNLLGPDNLSKRAMIADWFRRVPSSEHLPDSTEQFPEAIAAFNQLFMGPRGGFIRSDLVMPGQWSVRALSERFGDDPQVFKQLCKFKWSFNIKPDMVILVPGMRPVCIEAKLESREGFYPAGTTEGAEFDRHFGIGQGAWGSSISKNSCLRYCLILPVSR